MSGHKTPIHGRDHRPAGWYDNDDPGGADPLDWLQSLSTVAFHGCRAQLGARLTGTVAKTNGSTTIVGTGTLFLTEAIVGYGIHVPGGAQNYFGQVTAITDNTHLTVAVAPTASASGQTAELEFRVPNATFTPVKYQDEATFGVGTVIYDTDNYHFKSAAALTGTVAKTSGNATIVGTGTSFTSELSVNQCIDVPGGGGTDILVVKSITDATHVVVWNAPLYTASGQTATCNPTCFAIPAGLAGFYGINILDDWRGGGGALRESNVVINGNTAGVGFFHGGGGGSGLTPTGSAIEMFYALGEVGVFLEEGDFVQNWAYQDSGGVLTLTPLCTFELWLRGQPDSGVPGPAGTDGVDGTDGTDGADGAPGSGAELDYAENTSAVTVSATSAATATTVVTGAAISLNGSTKVKVEFGTALVGVAVSATLHIHLWDGSTDLGRIAGFINNSATVIINDPVYAARFLTPSNGSHTFSIRAYRATANCSIFSGAGGADTRFPIYMRVSAA